MVFEGILVDLLNRFLGSYVKNLDASQLKVGIFGGDVLLERLNLKENALDDLRLPVRIFGGHLDKLRLKIPWSSLYSSPVVVEIDGLYVLAGPASAAKYDAERDAREIKDRKDRQLKKIEEARKKSKEPKGKKDQAPGFVEKLVTQIIKNVQITVRNIHVTFEDGVSDPAHPFSVGVTLDSLVVQSTDRNYVIGGKDVDPVSQLIYKLVDMSCLSVYWTTGATLLWTGELPTDWADILKSRIARSEDTTHNLQHLLQPISAQARLQLTMKPGVDESIPQALVNVVLEHIAVSLGKEQYRDIMSLVESFDRMSINQKYLKYKPVGVNRVSDDPVAWWRYASSAVMEEVQRKSRMWSWSHIKEHRARFKRYIKLYVEKLLAQKVSGELQKKLDMLEVDLDVFNIILCRKQAESKAEQQQEASKQSGGGGWWAWLTGSGDQEDPKEPVVTHIPTDEEIAKEKEKLYEALGYSESGVAPSFSKEYVAHKVRVDLRKVSLQLYNEEGSVSELLADRVGVAFMQRPASNNITVTASLGNLSMNGRGQDGRENPTIIQTIHDTTGSLLDVQFELNPLGKKADYSIMARLKPIQIVYDADTVDDIIDMFLPPQDAQFQKLSVAASSTLEEVKTQGRAGLMHSIGQKKVMELDISLHSPYLIVPENGTLTKSSTVLVVDLGSLDVTSAPLKLDSVKQASMEELQAAFYDDFDIQLRNVQVIVSGGGEDWGAARRHTSSPLHILTPTMFDLRLKKSLMEDTRLPKFKISGSLPRLTLSLSDKKIKQILKIVLSLPIPPPSLANKPEPSKHTQAYEPLDVPTVSNEMLLSAMAPIMLPSPQGEPENSDEEVWYSAEEGTLDEETGNYVCSSKSTSSKQKTVSATKLDLIFMVPEIKVNFSEHDEQSSTDTPRLDLTVTSISASVQQRTWDLGVVASVGDLVIDDHYKRGVVKQESATMLSTVAEKEKEKQPFLSIEYKKADNTSPQFQEEFSSTQQGIDVSLSLVRLELHRESLINLVDIARDIGTILKIENKAKKTNESELSSTNSTILIESDTSKTIVQPVARIPGERDLSMSARLSGVELILSDSHGALLTANIKGV